eukprot:gnl/Spiro4/16218_TR8709_c0_g1_i1.p2 gnl/Spiro4/16218_TR8709_c0_g1~~gnl/Spiro4/16218_TR8709_c0_g1_i1.p2  ORF type:complete len:194 (-),score=84.51 gnl/Spiro4/16218_TR8709_c0_g1_i1:105-686(-)
MIIPKKNRLAIYSFLFKEGVLVTSVDIFARKHLQLEVPNLQVIKLMQSLKSRNYVKERYNWRYLYYFLTNEGIEYLRETLHISGETVPNTLKKSEKVQPPPSFASRGGGDDDSGRGRGRGRGGFRGGRGRGGRDEYRGAKKLDDGAPADFDPSFDSGRGRGRGRGGFRGRGRGGAGRGGRGGAVDGAAAPADS